jgi:hypothetical protein
MTETAVRPFPETPGLVAAAVLDAVEADPAAFSMSAWFWPHGYHRNLAPEQEPRTAAPRCASLAGQRTSPVGP